MRQMTAVRHFPPLHKSRVACLLRVFPSNHNFRKFISIIQALKQAYRVGFRMSGKQFLFKSSCFIFILFYSPSLMAIPCKTNNKCRHFYGFFLYLLISCFLNVIENVNIAIFVKKCTLPVWLRVTKQRVNTLSRIKTTLLCSI